MEINSMSSGVLHQALARGTPDLIRALGEGVRQAGLSDPALFARMLGDNESSFESPIIGALSSGKPENVKAFADLASTLGIVDPTSLARILVPPADYLKAFGTAETVAALEQVLQKAGIPRISPFDASGNPKTEQASVAVEGRQENVDKAKPRASKRKCLPCGW
ncbi:MAG: hypothetical protein KGJ64_01520 [Betaproteobacteria bacterium]|nr:hypothetical protein [Betaproteobacteria bacterium]